MLYLGPLIWCQTRGSLSTQAQLMLKYFMLTVPEEL